jgi:Ca2+/Na+ antiporter
MTEFYILIGLSLLLFGCFVYFLIKSTHFKQHANKAKAKVVENRRIESYDHENNTSTSNYYAVFRLKFKGKKYQQQSNIGRNTPKYKVGDSVDIWILPQSDNNAIIKESGWWSLNLWWTVSLIFCLIFSIIALLLYNN